MTKPIVVIGLGSALMSDEGVGAFLIEALEKRCADLDFVDFADIGSATMRAIHLLNDREKVVFLDCAFMNAPPGAIKRFEPDDVASVKSLAGLSSHEGDLLHVIRLAQMTGATPKRIVIFGIQPDIIAPGQGLSPTLESQFGKYCALIEQEIRR